MKNEYYYAKILNSKVIDLMVVSRPDFFDTFVDSSPGKWIECCYNTRWGKWINPETNKPDSEGGVPLRGNYPGLGWTYDEENDVFYEPQPYPSWNISGPDWNWTAPVPYPTPQNENFPEAWGWNEDEQVWERLTDYLNEHERQ